MTFTPTLSCDAGGGEKRRSQRSSLLTLRRVSSSLIGCDRYASLLRSLRSALGSRLSSVTSSTRRRTLGPNTAPNSAGVVWVSSSVSWRMAAWSVTPAWSPTARSRACIAQARSPGSQTTGRRIIPPFPEPVYQNWRRPRHVAIPSLTQEAYRRLPPCCSSIFRPICIIAEGSNFS